MTTNDKQVATTDKHQEPIYLSKMAPAGVDGRVWARVLKEQLLSSKNGDVTDEELLYFAQVAQATQLDPAKREIYGIFRGGKLSIQTGIDGFRVAAERSGKFGGSKEPEFEYDSEVKIQVNAGGTQKVVPNKARVTVYKLIGDRVLETTRTANWADYYPGDQQGTMWRKFPETMLAKVAEAQALRAAFPNCNQLYLPEEMQTTDADVPAATDMQTIAESIKKAKSLDELLDIITGLSIEQQRQVTDLAANRTKEIEEEETQDAPATN